MNILLITLSHYIIIYTFKFGSILISWRIPLAGREKETDRERERERVRERERERERGEGWGGEGGLGAPDGV